MAAAEKEQSIVEYLGGNEGHKCGYCKKSDTNFSLGFWAHSLTVRDYQDLIDRGWRRSGKYCYKPSMNKTCCPHYTIKQEALNYKISNSQKRVIKMVNRYLNDNKKSGETDEAPTSATGSQQQSAEKKAQPKEKKPKPNVGPDPSKPPCKKAKVLRMEKTAQKLARKGLTVSETKDKVKDANQPKSLDDFLSEVRGDSRHKLEMRLVRSSPRSDEFNRTFAESYAVYKKYQMIIHNDPPHKPSEKQFTRFLVDSPLIQIKLIRPDMKNREFLTTMNESYNVYKHYQMAIHKDSESDCDKRGFINFLVDSPLKPLHKLGGLPHGYGSFHQQYWLDGKIIMVGVIDILPHCISSVYLYYDPDFGFLTPGTYSALREIEFTRSLHKLDPQITHYYMGFYIHLCPKMRYKGQYYPSLLLCPEVYSWHPIAECVPKLDASAYSRFADQGKVDENSVSDLAQVLVLYERQAMPYNIYSAISSARDEDQVREYAALVGKKCAERMLLFRN